MRAAVMPLLPSPMDSLRHDHQQIEIAVRPHLASCGRAEKDDLERMDQIDDAGYQLVNDGRRQFQRGLLAICLPPSRGSPSAAEPPLITSLESG